MAKQPPLKVYIVGGDSLVAALLTKNTVKYHGETVGFEIVEKLKDSDIVVFTGGEDVNPYLYNEVALSATRFNIDRDAHDMLAWRASSGKLRVGICRGGQFLNVMNGGALWQHVDKHCISHVLTDQWSGGKFLVSSTHHQMFRPTSEAMVIATARESDTKFAAKQLWRIKNDDSRLDDYFKIDFEVLYYPSSRSLCFQPHPEYEKPPQTEHYFMGVLQRVLDFEATGDNKLTKKAG